MKGAGLGILRKVDFEIALIDEASQITEPVAIIPLCKGVRRAILVGDHVQLRPTVKKVGKALQFDVSLLERLYTGTEDQRIAKTMLDVRGKTICRHYAERYVYRSNIGSQKSWLSSPLANFTRTDCRRGSRIAPGS